VSTAPLVAKLVEKSVVADDGCWIYGKGKRPYPLVYLGWVRWQVSILSHLLWVGPITAPMVTHTCDNDQCWNPAHLVNGDALKNNRDRRTRALTYGTPGAKNHFAKLTEEQVAKIRESGDTRGMLTRAKARELAAAYGVTMPTIYRVFTGRTWRSDTRVTPAPRAHWASQGE
jgi:hypothetical protein